MKLKKYDKDRKGKNSFIILTIICAIFIGLFIYQSYANYQMKATFKLINGKLKMSSGSGDIEFAFYNGDQKVDDLPLKETGVLYVGSVCTNDATVNWNDEQWAPTVYNLKKTKTSCSLYFGDKEDRACLFYPDGAACKYYKAGETNEILYDDTDDKNLRYVGANPNNYVNFNNEVYETDVYYGYNNSMSAPGYKMYTSYEECNTATTYNYNCTKVHEAGDSMWRIIGIMNNIEDEDGNMGSHLKIIRDKFETNYSWDSSEVGVNRGEGVNEWSTSAMEKVLNDEYLNRRTGSNLCYKAGSNTTEACPDWETIGIRDAARNMISSVKWNIGSTQGSNNLSIITAKYMYKMERSSYNGKQCSGGSDCNDKVDRTTTWIGKVGLMYPSDYGYAVGGDVREVCLGKTMNSYNSDNCMTYDWIYDNRFTQWTMTPMSNSSYASYVYYIYSSGYVNGGYTHDPRSIRPTLYLASSVKIVDGSGEVGDPFVLSLN